MSRTSCVNITEFESAEGFESVAVMDIVVSGGAQTMFIVST